MFLSFSNIINANKVGCLKNFIICYPNYLNYFYEEMYYTDANYGTCMLLCTGKQTP